MSDGINTINSNIKLSAERFGKKSQEYITWNEVKNQYIKGVSGKNVPATIAINGMDRFGGRGVMQIYNELYMRKENKRMGSRR